MIDYDNTTPKLIFRLQGSNIPRAFKYTLPSVLLALAAHYMLEKFPEEMSALENYSFSASWSACVVVLSLLLSMRTAKAYDRFWEGITLVQLMRAEWFETASNLIAFSHVALKKDTSNQKVQMEVRVFQFTLVRLMSLLQGKALRSIGGEEEEFEVLDIQSLDCKSLAYLRACEARQDPVEVVLHWIQTLVIDAHHVKTSIPVPPPILTRVYQTLSRGMVHYHNARKLADVPFPYPLSQMVFVLLMIQALITPFIFANTFRDPVLSAVTTFLPLLGMWCLTFTAGELEQPFGNDPNDLPLTVIQRDYNISLLMLLDKETFAAPALDETLPLTVRDLRRKHTINTKHEISMTDSLPAPKTFRQSSQLTLRSSLSSAQGMKYKLASFVAGARNVILGATPATEDSESSDLPVSAHKRQTSPESHVSSRLSSAVESSPLHSSCENFKAKSSLVSEKQAISACPSLAEDVEAVVPEAADIRIDKNHKAEAANSAFFPLSNSATRSSGVVANDEVKKAEGDHGWKDPCRTRIVSLGDPAAAGRPLGKSIELLAKRASQKPNAPAPIEVVEPINPPPTTPRAPLGIGGTIGA